MSAHLNILKVSLFFVYWYVDNSRCAANNPAASAAVTAGLSGTYVSTRQGTYLNTDHPVMCEGNITKWHFCYYTQHLTHASRLNMTLAVWSFYEASYVLFYPGRFTRISIIHNHTLAKFFCIEHSLSREDYLPVSQDDIVGVVLPSVNPIPVIGSGETTDFLKYQPVQNLNSIMYNSLTSTLAVIHVEAVIGKQILRHSGNISSNFYFFLCRNCNSTNYQH